MRKTASSPPTLGPTAASLSDSEDYTKKGKREEKERKTKAEGKASKNEIIRKKEVERLKTRGKWQTKMEER